MRFTLTEEQHALRDTVRRLLDRQSDSAAVRAAMATPRGYDENLWSRLCGEIGVAALAVPEGFGGIGASLLETLVVLEELGRTLTPCPLLGSAVLAAEALLASADEAACREWLPGIADGRRIAALAWPDAAGRWSPDVAACTASTSANTSTLSGTAHYVLDGDLADLLLVVANTTTGLGLFAVDPGDGGVRRAHTPTLDPTRRLATVSFADAEARRLGAGDFSLALRRIRDIACVALSAEQVGAATRALELTVDYAKNRVQFGRPIGSFQALKHRMADLFVLTESARSASAAAAWSVVHDEDARPLHAAIAKTYCSETLSRVAAEMIQLHGGIGITWEHDAQLFFKRAHGSAQLFGSPAEHVTRLTELFGSSTTTGDRRARVRADGP